MTTLLLPLGLLGLVSVLILLIIYIIKPNYQQKYISSTFVWKLSLKYRRRRIPTSKLRNILLIACQVLILAMGAFIMSKPGFLVKAEVSQPETIAIIDASASMYSTLDSDETRFDRAINRTVELSRTAVVKGGLFSVIIADSEPYFLAERVTADGLDAVHDRLLELDCSYGNADIDTAVAMCEKITKLNPDVKIVVFTGTKYSAVSKDIRVEDVSLDGEWNIAILDAKAELVDNFYTISVNVACYGKDEYFDLYCDVVSVNRTKENLRLPVQTVYCARDGIITVVYTAEDRSYGSNSIPVLLQDNERVFAFEEIFIHVNVRDSIIFDNEYYIHSGNKQKMRIQYYSTLSNDFFTNALNLLCDGGEARQARWEFDLSIVRSGEPELSGYDMYIFEHTMPNSLPKDGVVMLVNPDKSAGAGFNVGRKVNIPATSSEAGEALTKGMEHRLTEYVDVGKMRITQYVQINEDTLDGYNVLMYYGKNPVYMVKEDDGRKIVVMAFSLHYSEVALTMYFPTLFLNFFNYFEPITFDRFEYDVYETASLNARGSDLTVRSISNEIFTFDEIPAKLKLNEPGTYTCSQQLISGKSVDERFYVRVDPQQSNICYTADSLDSPEFAKRKKDEFTDWILYLAIVIVALLFIEWELHVFEGN